ncbi:MAG: hypothetical protein JRD89_09335 [Deltaproteobacteria bacterium]|nr:hypothetical protein [Deltaproteobacteria bacterium]
MVEKISREDIVKEIEKEKELVRTFCHGLFHPDQANQKEFTRWLRNVVISHLDNLKKRLMGSV